MKYIPGVCNIGPSEIKARKNFGYFGIAITLVLMMAFSYLHADPVVRLLIFVPAFTGAIGLTQAYFHFCAAFGLMGVFNVARSLGKTDTILEARFRQSDRFKAMQILGISLFFAVLATLFTLKI